MPNFSEEFAGNYITVFDIKAERGPLRTRIVELDKPEMWVKGKKIRKWVIHLAGWDKALVMNKTTRGQQLADELGDDMNGWVHQYVLLYVHHGQFRGEPQDQVGCRAVTMEKPRPLAPQTVERLTTALAEIGATSDELLRHVRDVDLEVWSGLTGQHLEDWPASSAPTISAAMKRLREAR